jgi:hypothetical protein
VREPVHVLDSQPDHLQQLADARLQLVAVGDTVDHQRLADDLQHRHSRVERRERVLKNDLHVAPDRLQLAPRHRRQVHHLALVTEPDLAGSRLRGPEHHPTGGGLAAAGLAHQPERLALLDLETDAIDRLDVANGPAKQTTLDREVFLDLLDVE